jgi:predicted metal-dependent hydrolase
VSNFLGQQYMFGGFVVDYEDLLASLQELLEASSAMTSGQLPTASQLERYQRAREWAQRLIDREEKAKNTRFMP